MRRVRPGLALASLAVGVVPGASGGGGEAVLATVSASPLCVALSLSDERLGPGETARAAASLYNLGTVPVRRVTIALRGDPGGFRVTGSNPDGVAALDGASSVSRGWTICGRGPATYVLVARAGGELPSGAVANAESDARVVRVTGSPACR